MYIWLPITGGVDLRSKGLFSAFYQGAAANSKPQHRYHSNSSFTGQFLRKADI
jgi:hypothetical protein